MTPAARASAAIEVLDRILAGDRVEPALISWARQSRFAGSGDRLAVRDLVYQAMRRRRSAAWMGGALTGRGLVLGLLRLGTRDPALVFDGSRYGPPPITAADAGQPLAIAPEGVRLDCPDWLLPQLRADLGDMLEPVLSTAQERAPVFLRASRGRGGRAAAATALAAEGIEARAHPTVATALEVIANGRRLSRSRALATGMVEPMDAHSQAVVLELGDVSGLRVLDYCAGGGGKALMLADLGAQVTASDRNPRRMRDIAPRAARAGLAIDILRPEDLGGRIRWPLVLVDAPCSGSGTWRRDPEGKWALDEPGLAHLVAAQQAILDACAPLTAPGGRLAFVTCSALAVEGRGQAASFLTRHRGWQATTSAQFLPSPAGDGFQLAIFRRADTE